MDFALALALALAWAAAAPAAPAPADSLRTLPEQMELHEGNLIRQALATHQGDVQATIKALGIPRKTFYDKLQRHGIDRASYANGSAPIQSE